MSKIKIACTSTGCIDYAPERYRNLGIDILRIHVFFNGKEYREGVDLNPVEFYSQLEGLENPKQNLPHTGMPDTEEIQACFEKAITDGYDEMIVFAISAYLGGTYNKICLVAKDYEDRLKIHVVDTKITCFNEGFLAIKAQEFANQGMSSQDILKEIRWMMKHQVFMGVVGKLDYLMDYIAKYTHQDTKVVFNMTWAYQADSTHTQFPDYNSDQMTMYNAIIAATQEKVSYSVVPNATSIQNARTSLLGDTLTRDGYHLSGEGNMQGTGTHNGRYIAALTFFGKLSGIDLNKITYYPTNVTETDYTLSIQAAIAAIKNPFEVTL